MSNFKQDKIAAQYEELNQQNGTVFRSWLDKHPEVDFAAAHKLFLEYFDFTETELSDADFDFAYGNLQSQITKQRVPTEQETKDALIDKILDILKKGGTGYDTFKLLDAARTKMSIGTDWTVEKLTARLDEITRAQRMVKQPIAEVEKVLVDARQYGSYPRLPKQIVRQGTVRAVDLDAAYIRKLDVYDLKKLNRIYGTEAVNNRLAGKD
jgi:hypothetical protein